MHILSITEWTFNGNSRVLDNKTRVKLSDGEVFDTNETFDKMVTRIEEMSNKK
jgi:hypothetical protein